LIFSLQHLINKKPSHSILNAALRLFILSHFSYVVDQLTWADLAYYAYFSDFLEVKFGSAFLKAAPRLKALIDRVKALPNVQKWTAYRDATYPEDKE
jgi:glutathione S-transferase